ncbi:MAG: DUF1127 domain-containing protein [Xanthobacteraceae bacterium]
MSILRNGVPKSRVRAWSPLSIAPALAAWTGFDALLQLGAHILEYAHRRRMFAELNALDDRVLKDVGIGRSEIGYWVRRSAQSKTGRSP